MQTIPHQIYNYYHKLKIIYVHRFHLFLLISIIITTTICQERSLKCLQGEPNSGVVNPYTCYIDEYISLGDGDKLIFTLDSGCNASDILWVNFWIPKYSTIKEPSNLTGIPIEIFDTFPNVYSLSITARLKILKKDDFQNANNLHDLLLANNELEYLNASVFVAADNLEKLDLSFNRISLIEDNAFEGTEKLRYLYLQRNALTKINRNQFNGLTKLRSLILDHNAITEIEDGAFNLANLKELGLNKNKLKTLADGLFMATPNLYKLQITGNNLERIGDSLYNLPNIEYISLENNQIDDINIAKFANLPELQYLFLGNNGHPFDNATLFDIDINSTIKKSNLRYLIIADNKLSSSELIQDLAKLNLRALERLDLDGNEFQRINFNNVKKNFPQLITINLGVNNWSCEWLSNTFEYFDKENIDVNLFSSRFPFRSGVKQVRLVQCV